MGARNGYFDDLDTYCGMAFDRKLDLTPLHSANKADSLFVWSSGTMNELKARGGCLNKLQLVAVAYLWEFVYGLLLASCDDVSQEPGFEALGLRMNVVGRDSKSVGGDKM